MKDVIILTGAGQIGMAIACRMGSGKKIVIGDKSMENAQTIAKIMNEAGFDSVPVKMRLTSLTVLVGIFIGICLQTVQQAALVQRMKWRMWQNF